MSYPKSLAGKTALVVGGAGAIGAAVARMLAEAGAKVAITQMPGGEAAAVSLIQSLPGEGHAWFFADVADTSTLLALRDAVQDRYGRLDILINAAGFTKPIPHADLEGLTDDLIDRMFQVNWRGQFATIRTFAPMLKASGDGVIVSLSSIAGFTGVGSSIAYCAAKAGIDVMTKSLPGCWRPRCACSRSRQASWTRASYPGGARTSTIGSPPQRRSSALRPPKTSRPRSWPASRCLAIPPATSFRPMAAARSNEKQETPRSLK
jgi:3-oxoacyl-[acyl-carrier protein] reductase